MAPGRGPGSGGRTRPPLAARVPAPSQEPAPTGPLARAPVMSSAPNHASRLSSSAAALTETAGRSPHGTEAPCRHAPPGQATRVAEPAIAQTACASEPPACSGFAATSMPAMPPAIKISRPGEAAGRSASPVMTSKPPTTAKVSVITHRSAAPTAARALTVPAAASKEPGCSAAATVHPANSSTGAAADETTPHHGTPRTATTLNEHHCGHDRRDRPNPLAAQPGGESARQQGPPSSPAAAGPDAAAELSPDQSRPRPATHPAFPNWCRCASSTRAPQCHDDGSLALGGDRRSRAGCAGSGLLPGCCRGTGRRCPRPPCGSIS